jgi:type IV secretory pathway VirB4 component
MALLGKKNQQKTPPATTEPKALEQLGKGMASIPDLISPSSIEVDFRYIRVGETYYTTLFVVGYPRYVSPSWLSEIVDYDHTLDISMFIYPTQSADVLSDLKRKIAEMEATIASDAENGKPIDPKIEASLEDAMGLQEELAKGIERFFQFSFYLTLSSDTLPQLIEATKQLQTTLASLLLSAKPATLQMEEGFKSTVPLGQDKLFITRNMDTTSLASTFPFTSAMLTQDKGVMYGINQQNGSLIIFDRFSLENANEVVLGKSGAGKSYLIKLEIMRQVMLGTEVIVIDPEGEYHKLAQTLGGEVIEFSSNSPVKMNPFDLSQLYDPEENELGLKILSLHGLLKLITGTLDAEHDAILDKALIETYRQKGITPDPATQNKEAPIMEDLYKTLMGMEDNNARELGLRLEKFIQGSAAGIFNQQSNFDITNPLTIFSIKNLEEELRPIAMHIILDFVWTKVKKTLKKRLLILDEAWYMMKYEDSASFVYSIAKRSRKYYLGLTTATQDVEDFLKTDYGKAVLSNSSIQMLLKQGTSEVDLISEIFYLSEGEKELLITADIGEGLFFAGQNHVAMKVLAAPFEHDIITSNPAELLASQPKATVPPPPHESIVPEAPKPVEPPVESLSSLYTQPAPPPSQPVPPPTENGNVVGFANDITKHAKEEFANYYGYTPDESSTK